MRLVLEITRPRRRRKQTEVEDLVCSMWLYIGYYAESKLTTEQRELLYDLLDEAREPCEPLLERWWRQ